MWQWLFQVSITCTVFRALTFNQDSCKIPKLCRLLLLLKALTYLMADLNFNKFVKQQAMQMKLQGSGVHKLKLLGCQEYFTALSGKLRTGNVINISRQGSHSFPNVIVMSLPSDTRDYNAPSWSPEIRPEHYDLCVLCSVISRKQYPSRCLFLGLFFMCLNPEFGTLASYPHFMWLHFIHYLSSLNWGPRPHLCGDVPYFMSFLLCLLPAEFLQLLSEMELGMWCHVWRTLPFLDGVMAGMPILLCTGSSERVPRGQLNRQRLKSHYHSSSSWLCQILATSRESLIFCVPLKKCSGKYLPRHGEVWCLTCY